MLLDIPPEILLQISALLKVPRIFNPAWEVDNIDFLRASTVDLATLSLVSKEIRSWVAPLLFEDIAIPLSELPPNSAQVNRSPAFLANADLTRLAKTLRMPDLRLMHFRTAVSISDTNSSFVATVVLLPLVLQACTKLHSILDISQICLEFPAVMNAINSHPSLLTAWLDFSPNVSNSARFLAGLQHSQKLLYKFKGTLTLAPKFPLRPATKALLDQGLQIQRVYLDWNNGYSSLFDWLDSPYLSATEEFGFYSLDGDADKGLMIASALKKHPLASRVQLKNVPVVMVNHISGQGNAADRLTLLFPHKTAIAECDLDSARNIRCRTLSVMASSNPIHIEGDPAYISTASNLLDLLVLSFPFLQELQVSFPRYLHFPDGFNHATQTIVPQEVGIPLFQSSVNLADLIPCKDMHTIRAFSQFKDLQALRIDIEIPKENNAYMDRVERMFLSVFQLMPSLQAITVNPREKGYAGDSMQISCKAPGERGQEKKRLHVQRWEDDLKEAKERTVVV